MKVHFPILTALLINKKSDILHWLSNLYVKFLKILVETQTKVDFTTLENSGSYFMQVLPVSRICSIANTC